MSVVQIGELFRDNSLASNVQKMHHFNQRIVEHLAHIVDRLFGPSKEIQFSQVDWTELLTSLLGRRLA